MITVIVQYRLPPAIDEADCAAHFRSIAPSFLGVPGLISKQFICGDEDGWAGGIYQWHSREDAQAFYSGPWLAGIRERYGMDPVIRYFETAAFADCEKGAVSVPETVV